MPENSHIRTDCFLSALSISPHGPYSLVSDLHVGAFPCTPWQVAPNKIVVPLSQGYLSSARSDIDVCCDSVSPFLVTPQYFLVYPLSIFACVVWDGSRKYVWCEEWSVCFVPKFLCAMLQDGRTHSSPPGGFHRFSAWLTLLPLYYLRTVTLCDIRLRSL